MEWSCSRHPHTQTGRPRGPRYGRSDSRQRLRLGRAVVEDGWSITSAAAMSQVAWPTAKKWAVRYRRAWPAGMVDHGSRPHRSHRRTPRQLVRRIQQPRWHQRLVPVEIPLVGPWHIRGPDSYSEVTGRWALGSLADGRGSVRRRGQHVAQRTRVTGYAVRQA